MLQIKKIMKMLIMLFRSRKIIVEIEDMAQHGNSGVDNEGDHVEDANTERTINTLFNDTQYYDSTLFNGIFTIFFLTNVLWS